MPTFANDVKPASTGLSLGNENQKWNAHVEDVFADTVLSNTPNAADDGFVRLASTDAIEWRNAANTGNVSLSKTTAVSSTTPADTLVFSGAGIEGPLISHNLNPAATGEIRLAATDVVNFRNTANTADIAGLTHNADDTITVGGAGGSQTSLLSVPSIVTTTVSGNSGSVTLQGTSAGQVSILGGAGTSGLGGSINVTAGSGATGWGGGQVTLTAGSGGLPSAGGSIILNTGSGFIGGNPANGTLQTNAVVSKYNNIFTVKKGLPSSVAAVDVTAQTAAITTATLYTPPADGQYRLSWSAKITTAAGTSSTLGALTIVYTDPDGIAVTLTAAAVIAAGTLATTSAANTTGTVLIGVPQYLNCKASTVVSYAFAYASNAANIMAYNLHILLEAM